MKKVIYFSALLFLSIFFLSACDIHNKEQEKKLSADKDFNEVKVEDLYSIKVPKYMKKQKKGTLSEDASVEYGNLLKETYIVVLHEGKAELEEFLKTMENYQEDLSVFQQYAELQTQGMLDGIAVKYKEKLHPTEINGYKASQIEFGGQMAGVPFPISYHVTFIEGSKQFYMIMAWTLSKQRDLYIPTFQKIAETFKEL